MPQKSGLRARHQAASADDIQQYWEAMSLEERQCATTFHDPSLLKLIMSASQNLHKQHEFQAALMQHHGISHLGQNPFSSDDFLTEAFEFSWEHQRNVHDPSIVVFDKSRPPVIRLKKNFISKSDFFDVLRKALPDFLRARNGRSPLPYERWTEIVSSEPSSTVQMKAQLAKLLEQALWILPGQAKNNALKSNTKEPSHEYEVAFQPWMMQDGDLKVQQGKNKKSAKSKKKQTTAFTNEDQGPPKVVIQKEHFLQEAELEIIDEMTRELEDTWLLTGDKKKDNSIS